MSKDTSGECNYSYQDAHSNPNDGYYVLGGEVGAQIFVGFH